MGEDEDKKKDLTSLVELSALEMQAHPGGVDGHGGSLEDVPIEKISEADFGNLEEMSHAAHAAAANDPPPPETPPPAAAAPPPEALPPLEAAPVADPAALAPLDPSAIPPAAAAAPGGELTGLPPLGEMPPMAALDTGPGESPVGAVSATQTAGAAGGAQTFDLPSFSQIGTGEPAAAPLPPLGGGESVELGLPPMAINEGFPTSPQPIPTANGAAPPPGEGTITTPGLTTPPSASKPAASAPARSGVKGTADPGPAPKTVLAQDRAAIRAVPAGSVHTIRSEAPRENERHDLGELKKFAEKMSIGRPKIEGAPAFSLLIRNESGFFSEKTIKAIENALTSEEFGIRLDDVAVQLSAGKLLVPQISEFAAVTLAQKLRDEVDRIDVDLASEIFKSSVLDPKEAMDSMLLDTEEFESHREEVHDIGAEPRSPDDLFSTNLPEVREFQVTRILSTIMASDLIPSEIAEAPSSKEFEAAIEKLTLALIDKAFKLGAHGVLGVSFSVRSIEGYRDADGKTKGAYRLLGNGTAVRVRRRPSAALEDEAAPAPAADEPDSGQPPEST